MGIKSSSTGILLVILLLQNGICIGFTNAQIKVHSKRQSTEAVKLVPLLTTSTFQYSLSNSPSDVRSAQKICQINGGSLLSLKTPEELDNLKKNLSGLFQDDIIWTSAIRFTNVTDDLLVWSDTSQPFEYPLKPITITEPKRHPRDIGVHVEVVGTTTPCPCPCPTIPAPPPPAVCNRPICTGHRPACNEVNSRKCLIKSPPICEAQEKNCTVNCDGSCIILRQPECKVVSKPDCRLVTPNLGSCRTKSPPNCTIVQPGRCHSVKVNCHMKDTPCKPQVKPCKNPCSKQECQEVQPPCNKTRDPCPPPVTTCTKPFVDCSPEICQSTVLICPPRKLHCPPAQVICDEPVIRCDDPEVECPQPEVICGEPQIECSKPLVKCPDPVVNCDPIITTCERPAFFCSDPVLECPAVQKNCEQREVTCPVPPVEEKTTGGCGGGCCQGRVKRDVEQVGDGEEKIECIAMITGRGEEEWIAQNCNLEHKFICKM